MSAHTLRLWALAAALTLLSGAVMMSAGYLGHTESWAAGLITVPGGLLILAAFALARRSEHLVLAPAGSRLTVRAGAVATTLLSGGVMVLAGYAAAAWSWAVAGALALVGGVVIAFAFVLDRGRTKVTGG